MYEESRERAMMLSARYALDAADENAATAHLNKMRLLFAPDVSRA